MLEAHFSTVTERLMIPIKTSWIMLRRRSFDRSRFNGQQLVHLPNCLGSDAGDVDFVKATEYGKSMKIGV